MEYEESLELTRERLNRLSKATSTLLDRLHVALREVEEAANEFVEAVKLIGADDPH